MTTPIPEALQEQNLQRAMRAEIALTAYQQARNDAEDNEADIKDLISDLCHLLHLDEKTAGCMTPALIYDLLDGAYNHFFAEGVEPDDISLSFTEEA